MLNFSDQIFSDQTMTYQTKVTLSKSDKFVLAASKGDLSKLIYFMNDDLNYKATTKNGIISGKTALHAAAIAGNLKIVQFLLEQGASIDAKDSRGFVQKKIN